ncbi:MAG: S8 family serine peptidase, partial [Muribaculaceae bacterium]|nr:S8 family serine peptidase [Muribaculaceae bacterium]
MKRTILILIIISFLTTALRGERNFNPYIPRLVEIYDDNDLDSLKKEGVEILRRRGDILLCLFPNTDTRSANTTFRQRSISPALDAAKSFNEAYTVQNGAAAGIPFTGKGVVVGICDIGIDPLHPTFLDADGKSRIKRVVQYIEREGIRRQLDGDEEYRDWITDNPDNYHATHVCGILAGDGAGTPYSGIATDADIVVTVSTLTEVGLLAGVEDIIDYAKEAGKPAVINISVGSYTGPHDGTSLFSRYLDMCAEDAFIVLSAGNEGHRTNSLIADFTRERDSISFSIGNKDWTQFSMYGATDIWSGSSMPLSISLGIYDYNQKSIVRWLDTFTLTGGDYRSYVWDEGAYQQGEIPFIGELEIEGGVDEGNGRHRTILGYEYTAPEKAQDGNWARYVLTLKVNGQPGNDVEVYSDGTYTRIIGMSGSPAPSSDRTVSDLACGNNVICVGMYGNRDSIPYSAPVEFNDDSIYFYPTDFEPGKITRYSSYGTLRDGRVLPHTVAPGSPLISAGSRQFLSSY